MVVRPIPWCARDGHGRICRALARTAFVISEAHCLADHYRGTEMCIAGQELRQLFGRRSGDSADRRYGARMARSMAPARPPHPARLRRIEIGSRAMARVIFASKEWPNSEFETKQDKADQEPLTKGCRADALPDRLPEPRTKQSGRDSKSRSGDVSRMEGAAARQPHRKSNCRDREG
jgi:hypothetical protein